MRAARSYHGQCFANLSLLEGARFLHVYCTVNCLAVNSFILRAGEI